MDAQNSKTKSTFVTVFAWLMIVFNGFGLFISLMQNIMFATFFKMDEFKSEFENPSDFPDGFPTFIFKNFQYIIPLMGILILFALIASIGLLKRKNWARISFLFLLGFGILYMIAGTILQIMVFGSAFNATEIPSEFSFFSTFFIIFMAIITLGFIFLFGWLIYRLSSQKIKEEFKPNISESTNFTN
jgi:hypothetical protein